jgi:hypothetical protein
LGVVSQKVLSSETMSHHTLIAVKDMLKNYDPTTVSSHLIKPLKNLGVNIEEEAIFADPENISIIKKRLLEKISNGTFGHALDEINATKLPKEDFNEIIRAGIDNRMSNGNLHFVKSLLEKGFLPKAENSLRYIKYRKAVKKGFVACFKNSYFNIVEEIVEMNIFDETELYDHVILGLKEAFNNCNPASFQKVEVLLIKVKKHLPKEMGEKIDNLPIFKKIAENREADIIKQQALQRANKHY